MKNTEKAASPASCIEYCVLLPVRLSGNKAKVLRSSSMIWSKCERTHAVEVTEM
jgi:hypothetical protein